MSEVSLYADRDPAELIPHYSRHVQAMTAERLHAKADIAAELAYRDQLIERLRVQLAQEETQHAHTLEQRDAAEAAADALASGILKEPIDWPDHTLKWSQAIRQLNIQDE